jgi:RNA polymerase sigma-70 factor (sigma-E family)
MHRGRARREFEAFAQEHGTRLLRAAEHLTGDVHAAQDLLQIALTKMFVSWGATTRREPYAYARRVLVTCHIDSWRRRRWREESVADPADVPGVHLVEDSSEWIADRVALIRALAVLTDRERTVLVLRYLEDMAERDVAVLLGVSTGTVKSTTARALQKLRTCSAHHSLGGSR